MMANLDESLSNDDWLWEVAEILDIPKEKLVKKVKVETLQTMEYDKNDYESIYDAAYAGNPLAQYDLAECYYDGNGVAQDYAEAVKWYLQAAKQGYTKAQCRLGFYYGVGKGVAQDYTEAVKWYRHLEEVGWYFKNSGAESHPVGQKHPNAWGLYDMHGNVWEWCRDWYGDYLGDVIDPVGSSTGSRRICRGGSWSDSAEFCRSARRGYYAPSVCHYYLGFRLVLVPVQ